MSVLNGERYLAEAVDSILNQSFRDFEFVIIDDGSADGSGKMLDAYQKRDSRVRVYHQENRGLVECLNRGCSLAQGKYIVRMDADDIAFPDRLHRQVGFMEEHPEVGLLGGAIEYIDADGRVFGTARHPVGDDAIRCALQEAEGSFCHPATVMRKAVYMSTGGYRKLFLDAEDYDLWLRMSQCSQLANLEAVVLKYRIHSEQVSQRKLVQQRLSMLAAQQIVLTGKTKELRGLSSECAVNATVLEQLGVTEAKRERALLTGYRNCITTLSRASQNSAALALALEALQSSRWEHVERSLIAHLWLMTASLYWRQGRVFCSLLAVGRALMTWPVVVGRPLKPLFASVGRLFA